MQPRSTFIKKILLLFLLHLCKNALCFLCFCFLFFILFMGGVINETAMKDKGRGEELNKEEE